MIHGHCPSCGQPVTCFDALTLTDLTAYSPGLDRGDYFCGLCFTEHYTVDYTCSGCYTRLKNRLEAAAQDGDELAMDDLSVLLEDARDVVLNLLPATVRSAPRCVVPPVAYFCYKERSNGDYRRVSLPTFLTEGRNADTTPVVPPTATTRLPPGALPCRCNNCDRGRY